MRPVVLSCLVVVFSHTHLVTAGPFPSRHAVDLLGPQYASKTYGCLEGAAIDGLRRGYGMKAHANVTRSRVNKSLATSFMSVLSTYTYFSCMYTSPA